MVARFPIRVQEVNVGKLCFLRLNMRPTTEVETPGKLPPVAYQKREGDSRLPTMGRLAVCVSTLGKKRDFS